MKKEGEIRHKGKKKTINLFELAPSEDKSFLEKAAIRVCHWYTYFLFFLSDRTKGHMCIDVFC